MPSPKTRFFAALTLAATGALSACTTLLGVGSLQNVDCVEASGCADASTRDAEPRVDSAQQDGADVGEAGSGDDGGEGDAGSVNADGATDARVASDGSTDGAITIPPFDPAVILSGFGNVATQTGLPQQRHLVYGAATARFYLFYFDAAAPQQLSVRSSADFSVWRDEPAQPLSLPHGNEGRSFSVATAALGGADVFHVLLSIFRPTPNAHRTYHARARALPNGPLAWTGVTALTDLNLEFGQDPDTACDLDGPDVTITPDGRVFDFTGWETWDTSMCDGDVFAASNVDDGGPTWTPAFPSGQDRANIFYLRVDKTSNTHNLTVLPSGDVVGLFSNGQEVVPQGQYPDNVGWSRSRDAGYFADAAGHDPDSVSWAPLRNVFPAPAYQTLQDWASCATSDGALHAVRRIQATTNTFEHARYDGTAWTAAGTLPPAAGLDGSGVTLVRSGNKMLLFAIANDGSSVQSLAWDGSAWASAWRTVIAAGPPRKGLSSAGCATEPIVLWTEGSTGSYTVVGTRVDALFP